MIDFYPFTQYLGSGFDSPTVVIFPLPREQHNLPRSVFEMHEACAAMSTMPDRFDCVGCIPKFTFSEAIPFQRYFTE
jgi:hypothetical protein